MLREKGFTGKNSTLVKEFDRYIIEHPDFAEKIPDNALVVMQVEDDEEFNQWAREASQKAAENEQTIIYVTVTELKPVRSRIEKLRLETVAH